jgi:hypothetical protein
MPVGFLVQKWKNRLLLIEILRLGGRCELGHDEADNLWHGHNDAFRQVTMNRYERDRFLARKRHKSTNEWSEFEWS